jgi:hypothetical protein
MYSGLCVMPSCRPIKMPVYVKPYVYFAVHSVRQLLQVNIVHHHAAVSTDFYFLLICICTSPRFIFCWYASVRHHDVSTVNYKLHPAVQFFQSCSEMTRSAYECWVCQPRLKLQTESLQMIWFFFPKFLTIHMGYLHTTTLRQITWSMQTT